MLENKKNNICAVDSVYSLFIYLLLNVKCVDSTRFYFSDGIPERIRSNIKNLMFFSSYKKVRFAYIKRLLNVFMFLFFNRESKKVKHCKIYAQDHLFYSFAFIRQPYTLIEDGLGNYFAHKKSISAFVRRVLSGAQEWGYNKNAKSLILTGLAEIPAALKEKSTVINLSELWDSLDENEKKVILDIFEIDYDLFECRGATILLTQPFSEDGALTEDEKIQLYREIILNYSGEVVIKPHPREKTDYSKYLNVNVLPRHFPFELYTILNRPEKTVTCFSSCGILNNNVDFYGTTINQKLVERYGLIESKLNAKS